MLQRAYAAGRLDSAACPGAARHALEIGMRGAWAAVCCSLASRSTICTSGVVHLHQRRPEVRAHRMGQDRRVEIFFFYMKVPGPR